MSMLRQTKSLELQKLVTLLEFSDAHCHLNLFENPLDIVDGARRSGVDLIIAAGGSAKDNAECVELANAAEGVFAVVGISPDFLEFELDKVAELENFVRNNDKVIGIGEIGLDAKVKGTGIEAQREALDAQLSIAKELDMPVVIHSRGYANEVSEKLSEKGIKKALFHFFDGDEAQAAALTAKGYIISIPPVETDKRKRVIKSTSINSIVAETDSPIVGKDPTDVIRVCETIADLKGMSLEDVASATTENIRRLFYI